jgi:hypothetical protein
MDMSIIFISPSGFLPGQDNEIMATIIDIEGMAIAKTHHPNFIRDFVNPNIIPYRRLAPASSLIAPKRKCYFHLPTRTSTDEWIRTYCTRGFRHLSRPGSR